LVRRVATFTRMGISADSKEDEEDDEKEEGMVSMVWWEGG